jgi:hypothetical protein
MLVPQRNMTRKGRKMGRRVQELVSRERSNDALLLGGDGGGVGVDK